MKMKRLLLIILLLFFCVSMIVDAKLKFGSWDRWDESLPPWDNQNWNRGPKGLQIITSRDKDKRIFSVRDFYFGKASIIFYFSGNQKADILENIIPDPRFAKFGIVAFPPKDKKTMIRVYGIENSVSNFIGEWEVPFKNNQDAVTNEDFRGSFIKWLKEQFAEVTDKIIPEEEKTAKLFLPKLIINKKNFTLECLP